MAGVSQYQPGPGGGGGGDSFDPSQLEADIAAAQAAADAAQGDIDALAPRVSFVGPPDYGFTAWTYAPEIAVNNTAPNAGLVYGARVLHIPAGSVISNIHMHVVTAGSGLTAGQCKAALWDATTLGLLATTADQSGTWNTTGDKTMAVDSPVTVNSGSILVGFWANGTTRPAMSRGTGVGLQNFGLSTANLRFWQNSTGSTTTAAPATLTLATGFNSWWVGLS